MNEIKRFYIQHRKQILVALAVSVFVALIVVIILYVQYMRKKALIEQIKMQNTNLSPFQRDVVASAMAELEYWDGRKETDDALLDRLKDYYRAAGVNVDKWTKDQIQDTAWSSAFISYVVKNANGGDFKYSTSHSQYVIDSVANKMQDNNRGFYGYRISEDKLQPGDIVVYARQTGVDYLTNSAYQSHGDVVVKVEGEVAYVVGGNVSNGVTMKKIYLKEGYFDQSKNRDKYFVIVRKN
ncbi:MAG TPA: DUF2272 domain-containing protein [Flavipsychrobacter sp.]|nr:DUF2272 domain-containing protein [Flavipsychrobacter sp.]